MKKIGFAVDLGTTTIDYCLLKFDDGSMISNASIKNPQCLYGSDVINRILTITRDATFADVLKDQIINSLTACDNFNNWHSFGMKMALKDGYNQLGRIINIYYPSVNQSDLELLKIRASN